MLKHIYIAYVKNSYAEQYYPMWAAFKSAEAAQYAAEKDGYQFIDVREMDVI